jgi:predicted anti-sigma-YlaC factor YlaD
MSRLQTVWRLAILPCEGMAQLASRSLDGELELLERIALGAHVSYCSPCRRYLRQLRFLRVALGRLQRCLDEPESLPGPDLPDEIRRRIERELKNR